MGGLRHGSANPVELGMWVMTASDVDRLDGVRPDRKRYRVILWGPGHVGAYALRGIIDHPDLDLVGVRTYSADKEGRDAGQLCGAGDVGVSATQDVDALLALDADAVCYTGREWGPAMELNLPQIVDDMCRVLASGKNVVTPITPFMSLPSLFVGAEDTERLRKACSTGGASLHGTGIAPGFMEDHLVLALTSMSYKVDSVLALEIAELSGYEGIIAKVLGFGLTPDEFAAQHQPIFMEYLWGGAISLVADALNVDLDEKRPVCDTRLADFEFDTADRRIEKGTVAAVHYGLHGIVGGKPRIMIEVYYRVHPDAAPDWPQPPGLGGYRIEIAGSPSMRVDATLGSAEESPMEGMILATGMRAINSIPAVCEAAPGFISSVDLPTVVGQMFVASGGRRG